MNSKRTCRKSITKYKCKSEYIKREYQQAKPPKGELYIIEYNIPPLTLKIDHIIENDFVFFFKKTRNHYKCISVHKASLLSKDSRKFFIIACILSINYFKTRINYLLFSHTITPWSARSPRQPSSWDQNINKKDTFIPSYNCVVSKRWCKNKMGIE